MFPPRTTLTCRAGELCVLDWPAGMPAPFGLQRSATGLRGPLRLRRQVRARLADAGFAFVDDSGPVPAGDLLHPAADLDGISASAFAAWREAGGAGILAGLPWPTRVAALAAAVVASRSAGLLIVRDTAVLLRWQAALLGRLPVPTVDHTTRRSRPSADGSPTLCLATPAAAARDIGWLGHTVDLLLFDDVELLPAHHARAITDGCAALRRLGFANAGSDRTLLGLAAGIGPLAFALHPTGAVPLLARRVPLGPQDRAAYDEAWHRFLIAFDRFALLHPRPRFAAFVAWARGGGGDRTGLLAWHHARGIAAWNAAKCATVAELIGAHRGQRILVFTPDRASAYQLARQHLMPPLTAELSRRERTALLQAFHSGALPGLIGPKLLDLGVEPGFAEVGIAVGGPRTAAELLARRQRIAPDGVFHQLIAQDTLEVNHAGPERVAAAAAPAAVHGSGR